MDVDLFVLHMLASKEKELKVTLEDLKFKEALSRKGVQSCLGLLNHYTDIIPAGHVSLNRMLPVLESISPTQDSFAPNDDFCRDLRWWYNIDPQPVMEIGFLDSSNSEFVDAPMILDLGPISGLTQHFFFLPASGYSTGLDELVLNLLSDVPYILASQFIFFRICTMVIKRGGMPYMLLCTGNRDFLCLQRDWKSDSCKSAIIIDYPSYSELYASNVNLGDTLTLIIPNRVVKFLKC